MKGPGTSGEAGLWSAFSERVEYLRAAIHGRCFVDEFPSNKICPKCWEPGGTIDERWAMADVKYCFFCGQKMIHACPRCKQNIHIDAKFCPECGLSYRDLLVRELVERRAAMR